MLVAGFYVLLLGYLDRAARACVHVRRQDVDPRPVAGARHAHRQVRACPCHMQVLYLLSSRCAATPGVNRSCVGVLHVQVHVLRRELAVRRRARLRATTPGGGRWWRSRGCWRWPG